MTCDDEAVARGNAEINRWHASDEVVVADVGTFEAFPEAFDIYLFNVFVCRALLLL